MKTLIIGLPIVIACLVAAALAVGSMALAQSEPAPKASPSEHVEGNRHPPV